MKNRRCLIAAGAIVVGSSILAPAAIGSTAFAAEAPTSADSSTDAAFAPLVITSSNEYTRGAAKTITGTATPAAHILMAVAGHPYTAVADSSTPV